MSEEDTILENEIQKRQRILDEKWNKPNKYYINGYEVSYKEYEQYQEEQRQEKAKEDAELSFYRRCTSTGEEWEVDSDGEYIPDWLYDK